MKLLLLVLPLVLAQRLYCPSANDLVVAYNNTNGAPQIYNGGWSIVAGGAVASKSSFNLLGGWIAYDVDWTGVPTGVNANIYSISPQFNEGSFTNAQYCDGQPATSKKPWCVEADWIESNGYCGGASTLHTWEVSDNSGGCGGWGCGVDYSYNGQAAFKMNVSFDTSGHWTVTHNGQNIGNLSPAPGSNDWDALANAYRTLGAVIYSSQWVGWVPSAPGCDTTNGNLNNAKMAISNIQIYGSVVQGPTPATC
eukprot:TRINITY_DN7092_c0_g1_i7.p1 TRINITY_DN7092_c0_g1~~TRINITY_DN7092_c0_g1_i7.p1  ORF type:complete len:252 (-),score=17.47 TRINITY_DN7092_c0_g1_i7:105-860(-)